MLVDDEAGYRKSRKEMHENTGVTGDRVQRKRCSRSEFSGKHPDAFDVV